MTSQLFRFRFTQVRVIPLWGIMRHKHLICEYQIFYSQNAIAVLILGHFNVCSFSRILINLILRAYYLLVCIHTLILRVHINLMGSTLYLLQLRIFSETFTHKSHNCFNSIHDHHFWVLQIPTWSVKSLIVNWRYCYPSHRYVYFPTLHQKYHETWFELMWSDDNTLLLNIIFPRWSDEGFNVSSG